MRRLKQYKPLYPKLKNNPSAPCFQVHVLEQMKNVKSYGFVREKLDTKALQVHGLWFDIGGGEMFMYSKMHNRFIVVNEQTLKTTFEHLTNEEMDKPLFS